ncbi:peptide/nickel transport system substrate-binding protein [Arthrobacter sp. 1088]|uniref:ABC transporter substrate-binding protein n=1 Tax=Arthrobacter sp. 1088 TaxID=2817768 RepID=UPI002854A8E2|nr:ABC transporter substrate-binding protein [Arthrobacter sp. 1088]MDR6688753.1 peptide/nickel transport system substrate-binding protein [Arthrobacter sp. 1088]
MKKSTTAAALVVAAALALSGCAGGGTSSDSAPAADPVSGGIARVVEAGTPTSLDPALLQNTGPRMPVTGNSLYGQLVTDDPVTGEIKMGLLEEFATSDGGKTFAVRVREGVKFSDGTPFTADAVKFGWDRIKLPATASSVIGTAALIDNIKVVDELTATVTMTKPTPHFPSAVLFTQMNWIGSPAALQAGAAAFNANPIGAGPFVLEKWTQGDVLKLKKNQNYYVPELPYLDGVEVRGIADPSLAYNALVSGQADVIATSTQENAANAQDSGQAATPYILGGGNGLIMNTSKAPFDDVRARQAVSYALDMEKLNESVYGGFGELPKTLFKSDSPLFADVPVHTFDKDKAQKLFNELAAEGKPLNFTMAVFPGSTAMFEAVQAQLSQYDNVTITANQRDQSEQGSLPAKGDFQLLNSAIVFNDPDPRIWLALNGEAGSSNYSRLNDAGMNAALNAGRDGKTVEERAAAYKKVAERFQELVPMILTNVAYFGTVESSKVHGIHLYGMGSLAPDTLWLQP